MKRGSVLLLALGMAVPTVAGAEVGAGDFELRPMDGDKKPHQNPECISFTAQAVYGVGYDHVVHIDNDCKKRSRCDVSTDVNPDKITVVIEPKKSADVVTFRGSPAREFTATVICHLEG